MRANALIILLALANTSAYAQMSTVGASLSGAKKTQATAAPAAQADLNTAGSFQPGAGTVIVAELSKPLDAGRLKVGDQVECVLLQDLLFKGKVVVPHNAKAWGHVTEVVRATKGHPESRLGLVFDKIVLQGKKELPFQYPAIVAAVAAPIRGTTVPTTKITDMPVQMERGRDTGGRCWMRLARMPSWPERIWPRRPELSARQIEGSSGLKM